VALVRTVGHTIRASEDVLADTPRLQDIINGKMMYGWRLAAEAQILNGLGTNETIRGILATPGIGGYTQRNTTSTPTERISDALRKAATLASLANFPANGIVLHPLDWQDVELERDTTGGLIVATNVSIGAEQRLWRMRVVDSPAIAQKTALVGSFGLGATVYDREDASILVSTEDRDNVVRDAVTIRCKGRLALSVENPESFVKVTLFGEP
jgi:HK97 family phage major capsid protein